MQLRKVITALRERIPDFGGRVGGAAAFRPLSEVNKLALPAAYVIPLHDEAGQQQSRTDYWQSCVDSFSVVVALDNRQDASGFVAIDDAIDVVRSKLWQALLGWQPDPAYTRGIEYRGGTLLEMNRAILYYRFDFQAAFAITEEDTWQFITLQALPSLETVHIDIDLIDPGAGPDGRAEFQSEIVFPSS